ncbi:MAG: adenosylhomocysteinase, partial [Spirochaetaceae bacterium]|nr:adenosylhomocysteinase [Spirochaetaceae bacterium]
DLSFADQALCVKFISEHKLDDGVHPVPLELDMSVAQLKLETMGIKLDTLTAEQTEYMNSWSSGT